MILPKKESPPSMLIRFPDSSTGKDSPKEVISVSFHR